MPVKTEKIVGLDRDVNVLIAESAAKPVQQKAFVEFAHQSINEAKEVNQKALGRVPPYVVVVDGRRGAPVESVKPDGVIFVEFQMLQDALLWIHQQLTAHSPVSDPSEDRNPQLTYSKSNKLYADNAEVAIGGPIPQAAEYAFVNTVPYARRIERGSSSQAPTGVYQAVAVLARRRFGNIAKIFFSFVTIVGGERNPAIIVRGN